VAPQSPGGTHARPHLYIHYVATRERSICVDLYILKQRSYSQYFDYFECSENKRSITGSIRVLRALTNTRLPFFRVQVHIDTYKRVRLQCMRKIHLNHLVIFGTSIIPPSQNTFITNTATAFAIQLQECRFHLSSCHVQSKVFGN